MVIRSEQLTETNQSLQSVHLDGKLFIVINTRKKLTQTRFSLNDADFFFIKPYILKHTNQSNLPLNTKALSCAVNIIFFYLKNPLNNESHSCPVLLYFASF